MIDFREARLLDPRWWKRRNFLINAMIQEDDLKMQESLLAFHLALVSNSGLNDDSFKTVQEKAKEDLFDMMGLFRPWEGMTAAERKAKEYESLLDEYKQEFGDPSTPEFKAKEAAALAEWNRQLATQPSESDLERIVRLRYQQTERIRAYRDRK